MTVSVADVDRWSPEDVREVFRAAHGQAAADFDTSQTIATLPAFREWGGDAAQAAAAANEQLRRDLDASGNEALAVARAANIAADDMERVKADLSALESDAGRAHMLIDRATSRVVPGPGFAEANPLMMVALADMAQFQDRLDTILAHAAAVDDELAEAIRMATGAEQIPEPPKSDAELEAIIAGQLPKDPTEFNKLWEQLSRQQRDRLFARDPFIGNTDGMPSDDRDYYNRRHLADLLAHDPTHKADLLAVHQAVQLDPNRKLLLLDTRTAQVHAAVAIGDPDDADNVSVTTPGLNTTVAGGMVSMTSEANNLRQEALRQLRSTPGHENDTVATIAWIGYDAPQVPGWDDTSVSAQGIWDVSHDALAKTGAANLSNFYDGLQAAHEGGPSHLTAIGHSYGSLTTGLALQDPGNHGVSDAIFYGSPGIEATTPGDLQLQPGHVYTMETPDDPIQGVYDAKAWLPAVVAGSPILGGVLIGSDAGDFGPNPATNPNFTHMGTGPAPVSDGHGGTMNLEAAHGHSDYPRWGSNNLPRTTGYNIAAVVAGLPTNVIPQN